MLNQVRVMTRVRVYANHCSESVVKSRPGIHTGSFREKHDGFLIAMLAMSSRMIDMSRIPLCMQSVAAILLSKSDQESTHVPLERNVMDS
jgi:hypothetical protein